MLRSKRPHKNFRHFEAWHTKTPTTMWAIFSAYFSTRTAPSGQNKIPLEVSTAELSKFARAPLALKLLYYSQSSEELKPEPRNRHPGQARLQTLGVRPVLEPLWPLTGLLPFQKEERRWGGRERGRIKRGEYMWRGWTEGKDVLMNKWMKLLNRE